MAPILFLLFINAVPSLASAATTVRLFADDAKLYLSFQDPMERQILQHDLDSFTSWTKDWQLNIQPTKCAVLTLGHCPQEPHYSIHRQNLAAVPAMRDLGISVDRHLFLRQHIEKICSKAHRALSLLFACFLTGDREALVKGYKSFVRSQLEYATSVWNPRLNHRSPLGCLSSVDQLESVQRAFTRRLFARCGLAHLPYVGRLDFLQLEPLELRRLKSDLSLTYKLLHGLVDEDFGRYFDLAADRTRGHGWKLRQISYSLDLRANFFSIAIVPIWNGLPASVVSATSLLKFKSGLSHCSKYLLHFCNFARNI